VRRWVVERSQHFHRSRHEAKRLYECDPEGNAE